MEMITLKIDDSVKDKFFWLLKHFDKDEITILDRDEFKSDDDYLRSIDGMVDSILESRREPIENGVTLEELDW